MTTSQAEGERDGVSTRVRGPLGMLVLSRPATLNALTIDMVKALNAGLGMLEADNDIKLIIICSDAEKAFCAGGDMKQIRQHVLDDDHDAIERYFTHEYALDLAIARCSKPYLALMNGVAMGGGLGVSVNGRFRVVTEKALLAMPESRIGFFPDVGATWFLPRLPLRCGYWLGLTAASIRGHEAVQTGLATHYIHSGSIEPLLDTLATSLQTESITSSDEAFATVEQVLTTAAAEHQPSSDTIDAFDQVLAKRADWFADGDVDAIRSRLQEAVSQSAEHSDDAAHLLALLDSGSPYSVQITLALFRKAQGMALEDCLQLELVAALQACRHPDLAEGVRAVLVDKDRNPQWARD